MTSIKEEMQPSVGVQIKPTGTLARLMKRATSDENGGGGEIKRRRFRFIVDHNICEPGMFDEDFTLVLSSPSSETELAAIKAAGSDPGGMLFEMVKRCMISINGDTISDHDLSRHTVWEALGTGGRTMITNLFAELTQPSPEAMGKARTSTKMLV